MKVKNKTIYLTRGETCALNFKIWSTDGTPFILPSLPVKSLLNIAKYNGQYNMYEFYQAFIPEGNTVTIECENDEPIRIQAMIMSTGAISVRECTVVNNHTSCTLEAGVGIIAIECGSNKIVSLSYTHGSTVTIIADPEKTVASVLALTVRAGSSGRIVLQKYLNLCSPITTEGKTDYIPFGWNQFTSQDVLSVATPGLAKEEYDKGNIRVVYMEVDKSFWKYSRFISNGVANTVLPYEFDIILPLLADDTDSLEVAEYQYDLICYQGIIKGAEVFDESFEDFPLKKVLWKKELIEPNALIIGDSNNA